MTALMLAAKGGHTEVVAELLLHPSIDLELRNKVRPRGANRVRLHREP